MAPQCLAMNKVDNYKFIKVFEGAKFYTYVFEYDHTIAASQVTKIHPVSTIHA